MALFVSILIALSRCPPLRYVEYQSRDAVLLETPGPADPISPLQLISPLPTVEFSSNLPLPKLVLG